MRKLSAFGLFLVIAILCIGFTSCSDDPYESRINELVIKDVAFPATASSDTQTFRNEDLSNYVAKSSESWCNVSFVQESSQMIVTAEANETYDDRTAIVTISDTQDPTKTRTFTVSQVQKDGLFVPEDQTSFNIPTEGKLITVDVMTNIDFKVNIPSEYSDWIKQSTTASTRGLVKNTLTFNIAKNETYATRKGYIEIYDPKNTKGEVIRITINQAFTAVFNVDPQKITVDELRNEISIKVNTNVPVDVNEYSDWIMKGTIEEVDDENFIYKMIVTPFTEKKLSRTGGIVFAGAISPITTKEITVTVVQNRLLYIEETGIDVNVGGRLALTLTNDTDQEVVWTSDNEKVATVTKDGTVIGVSDGEATITVKTADGKYSDSAKVQVKEASAALLSDTWSKVIENGLVTSFTITLTNKETDRTIQLKPGSLYRVTVDGDERTMEKIGEDSVNKNLGPGESHSASFSSVAPSTPSSTATYSYYMEWDYTVDLKDFVYTANEK